jgi:hypothetical protein
MSKQRIILENWRRFLNESRQDVIASEDAAVKEFEGKLIRKDGNHKDNQHLTAKYEGFAICKVDNPDRDGDDAVGTGPITFMKGKAGEHERGFTRGSGLGTGRYDFDEWEKEKADVRENGIENPILIVAEWKGDNVIARVYEGNHRIRLGCQTQMPIPVEIRFFGKSEEHIDEVYFDFDLRRLIQYGLQ